MSHPFDLMCKNHPDRKIDETFGRADRLCNICVINAWNAGARAADAGWHRNPPPRQPEPSVDGRALGSEYPKKKDEL